MAQMRAFTIALTAAVMAAGMLPAIADTDPVPGDDPSGSPSASPSVQPSTPPPPPAVYPVFNNPGPGQPDPAISNELVRLIDGAPPGATVRASYFVVQPNHPVVDALITARGRGVEVQAVLDSGVEHTEPTKSAMQASFERLAQVLGTDITLESFATQCVLGCISAKPSSINHNKFVTISSTGGLSDVVFQSTANLRSDGSGDAAWNAATITSGNPSLYEEYAAFFGDLATSLDVPDDDYNAYRPPSDHLAARTHFFPRNDGTDTVSATLRDIDCSAAPTQVNVMAAYFTRNRVRNRLNDLAAAGCTVRVLARADTMTPEFCDSLKPPIQVRLSPAPSVTGVAIHGKYLTISGAFEDRPDANLVWMGSHNLTRNALDTNDEAFLLTDDAALHGAFVANFDTVWNSPAMNVGCRQAQATDISEVEEEANIEVTPLIKEDQTLRRELPTELKKRTRLRPKRTDQGQRVRSVAKCKIVGSGKKFRERPRCDVKRPKVRPTLVLKVGAKKRLRVRVIQRAKGTATLRPLKRRQTYTYRVPRKR